MLLYFARQDLAQRFTGNALGVAWAVLAPLLQLALFAFVFSVIFKARVPGLDGMGYVAFLSLAMWPWFAFAEAVARATTALTEQSALLGKVAVSPVVLVAARVLTAFALHGVGFVLVLAVLTGLQAGVSPLYLPAVLPAWSGLLLLAFGAGLLLALGNVFVRDLQQIVAYLLPALMFLSPILYPVAFAPAAMAWWWRMNPIAGYVEAVRDPLLFRQLDGTLPLAAFAITAVFLALAWLLYRRLRAHVVDFL